MTCAHLKWVSPRHSRLLAAAPALLLLASSAAWPRDEASVPVTAVSLDEIAVRPVHSAPATVVSLNDSQISAQIDGTVEKITVRPGDMVEPEALLVRLDCTDHKLAARQPAAQLEAARAEHELAISRFERADTLRERGAMPPEEFQQRRAAVSRTAAEVRRLEAVAAARARAVSKCEIRAPFRAVVAERLASVGELASPGMLLLRIVDEQQVEISSQIQEQDLPGLRDARRVAFVTRDHRYPVALRSVIPVLDRRISSFETRFELTGSKPSPGQAGRIEWESHLAHLPPELLVRRNGEFGVFIVRSGRARLVPIKGASPGQPAPTDLPGATRVIADGRHGLADGQPVEVVRR